jgi:hypothetical protein
MVIALSCFDSNADEEIYIFMDVPYLRMAAGRAAGTG